MRHIETGSARAREREGLEGGKKRREEGERERERGRETRREGTREGEKSEEVPGYL